MRSTASPDFNLVGNFKFGVFSVLGFWTAIAAIVSVMLSDFFDTMGTAVGLGKEAGLLDEDGRLPGIKRVLFVDGGRRGGGRCRSASSNTTYIESGAGIGDGGRTGLTSVVVGVLFLAAMFFSPIAGIVPPEATAPALIIVGYLMMKSVGDIDWRDPAIGIPALLTITLMPFTYSITNGVGAGFVSYTLIKVLQGKARDVHPLTYIVSVLFIGYFVRGCSPRTSAGTRPDPPEGGAARPRPPASGRTPPCRARATPRSTPRTARVSSWQNSVEEIQHDATDLRVQREQQVLDRGTARQQEHLALRARPLGVRVGVRARRTARTAR